MRLSDEIYPRQSDRIARRAHRTFVLIATTAIGGLIAWAATTELDRVTRGQGRVVPQTQNQIVQHFEGGIVTDILVREGEQVSRGQPLFRIENSIWRSELGQIDLDIKAKRLRLIRLETETKGLGQFKVPDDLARQVPKIVERELALFEGRQKTLMEQLAILDDQFRQKELELSELRSRWVNTSKEREIVNQRYGNLRKLAAIGGVSANEMLESQRVLQQIDGRLSELLHDIPRMEASLSEVHRRRSEAGLRFRSDAEKERSDTELLLAKNEESALALRDRSSRADVVAPIAGVVNRLNVTTVGGVVKSGEPLLQLVPVDVSIAVEARLSPVDRAEVWPGQQATVKISAYDYSIYGGLPGKVIEISPDALSDEKGQPYFRVRLEAESRHFGEKRPVIPGMLAEVDIMVGRRTILSSLIRPIKQIRDNAFKL